MENLLSFISENMQAGGIQLKEADEIKELWNRYKLPSIESDCSIISADFGRLGCVCIRRVLEFQEPSILKYESGNYDYVSIKSDSTLRILWTDYKNIEPYNRNGGLYAEGASFGLLGLPTVEKEDYREFISEDKYISNISFAVWGFNFNDYYKSVSFGLCIKNEDVDQFIKELRAILGK